MRFEKRSGSLGIFPPALLLFLFISCFQQPVNPYLPNNTKIYLTIDSTATLKTDNTGGLVDSTGNPIKVGISYNLPSYIDSIIIQVISSAGLTEKDTVFKNISAKKSTDTSWYTFTFSDDGKKTIKAYAFIQQNFKDSGTVQIAIYDKPGISPPVQHSHPHLSITGTANISNAQTCNLVVSVQDSNSSQAHTFIIKQDTLSQIVSTTAPTFTWTPPTGFIGTSTVFFKVSDSDSPAYFDTQTIIITVTAAIDTSHPVQTPPTANNQNLSTKKNTALSIMLTASAATGETLSNWIVVTNPANGIVTGTAPSLIYTPNSGFIGFDSLAFTVSDGKNTSNAAKIKINVSDVLVAPVASKTIVDTAVIKGASAVFTAIVNAQANPSPSFSWFKGNATAPVSTSQTYTIAQTGYSDQGQYRYIVSNSQGSDTSNWITLTVKDTTAPVITLKGTNPLQMQTGTPWTDPGATASDDRDGDISASIVVDTTGLKTNIAGAYTVSYNVKDKAGNAAITLKRTVNVSNALVAPIAGKAIPDISVVKGASASFVATANTQANPSPTFSWYKGSATAPVSTSQTYTIAQTSYSDQGQFRYIVSNSQGSDTSNWITLTIKDTTAPVITLKGSATVQIQINLVFVDSGATAIDDKDGDISSTIVVDASSVKTNTVGTYTVTYNVKDKAGNAALTVKRTVVVSAGAPGISGITTGDGTAIVTWIAAAGATSYNLYYAQGNTVDKTSTTKVIGAASPATVTGLTNGLPYAFAVSSVTVNGESALSPVMTATPQAFTIVASVTGSGGSISPSGNVRVLGGANQTFTITINPGYTIASVMVDGNADAGAKTSKQEVFTNVTAGHTVVVTFALKQYTITSSIAQDAGTVTGSITLNPAGPLYDSNSTVTLTAPTDNNYTFTGWTGAFTSSANQISVVMNGNKTLTANYTKKLTLTINIPSGDGTVALSAQGPYASGAQVTLTPTPVNSGYIFTGWSGDASGSANPLTITMNANKNITANFAAAVTLNFDAQGGTNPASIQVASGSTLGSKLPGTPANFPNCNFVGWFSAPNNTGTQHTSSTTIASGGTWFARWTVTDASQNVYPVVRIGTQTWMAANLATTKYNDGSAISSGNLGFSDSTEGYEFYDNDPTHIYGALYNLYSVNTGKLAPTGWHVASDTEWTTLINYLGGTNVAGGYLKEAGTAHWSDPNTGANNQYGFTALPGGGTGTVNSYNQGMWWSSTYISGSLYGSYFVMNYQDPTVQNMGIYMYYGLGVRCVKNSN